MNIADLDRWIFMLWECQECYNRQSIRIEPSHVKYYADFQIGNLYERMKCFCGKKDRWKLICKYPRGYVGIWDEKAC